MQAYISFRTDDKGFVGRLRLSLNELLPELNVKQSNQFGSTESIESIIQKTDVLIIVIGKCWLHSNSRETNLLHAPGDHVRRELIAALKFPSIRIAPVLIEDVKMPSKMEMPQELISFTKINAATIKHNSFEKDVMRVVEMLKAPGDESAWLPSVAYGTIQIKSPSGGIVKRYLETEFSPVTVILDSEEVGTMRLINNTFELKVLPGKHKISLKPGDKTGSRCECPVLVKQGQITVLTAERNSFTGSLSLQSANKI